jgi:glycosyltransferase involved in cell wall biosynthesis
LAAVLLISHDLVGPRMAGPGMRYWELASVLARHGPAVLAAPEGSRLPGSDDGVLVELVEYARGDEARMRALVRAADVVVAPGDSCLEFPFLLSSDRYLVMDGYDPHTFESLAWNQARPLEERLDSHQQRLRILQMQCAAGDFFVCASERQRMLWLGWLEAAGRENPLTYDHDPTLRALVDTVPTGVPASPPRHTCPLVRGVVPGIGQDDPLLVWGGGVWNWLDPLTLIEAVARLKSRHPDLRLYFPGARHPYQTFVPDMSMRQAAVDLCQERGLNGTHVFWGDWVPYEERQNYLLEADVGCSMHFETAESYFSFRTRVLDYIWAGLPMVVTRGDAASEWVERYGLGAVVDYGDVDGVARAIEELLARPRSGFRAAFELARQARSWAQCALPLVRFCDHPRRATDKVLERDWARGPNRSEVRALERELERLRETIAGYERGRFIRLMNWLHGLRRKARARLG